MRVILSGGTGQLGTPLLRLLRREHQVVVLSSRPNYGDSVWLQPDHNDHRTWLCDITDENSVKDALWTFQPEVIFHLAARAIVKEDGLAPCEISKINVLGTHHLLAHCPVGVRFVLASSATVYGDNTSRTMPADERLLPSPTSVYAATKLAQEALVDAYTALGKVRGLSLRLVASVGSGANHGLLRDIHKKLQTRDKYLELIGEAPGSCKPFSHVEDTVRAFAYFGLETEETGVVNVAPYDSITVLEVANLAMNVLKIQKPIDWLGQAANWAGDNGQVHISSEKMRRLGFRPQYSKSGEAVQAALCDILRGV